MVVIVPSPKQCTRPVQRGGGRTGGIRRSLSPIPSPLRAVAPITLPAASPLLRAPFLAGWRLALAVRRVLASSHTAESMLGAVRACLYPSALPELPTMRYVAAYALPGVALAVALSPPTILVLPPLFAGEGMLSPAEGRLFLPLRSAAVAVDLGSAAVASPAGCRPSRPHHGLGHVPKE